MLEDEAGPFLALLPSGSTRPRIFRIAAPNPLCPPTFDAAGRRLAWGSSANGAVSVWDLDGPPDFEPLVLTRSGAQVQQVLFAPRDDWLAVPSHDSLAFWPLKRPTSRVLRRHVGSGVLALRFTPDSSTLASCAGDGLGLWPLKSRGRAGGIRRKVGFCEGIAFSTDGRMAWVNVTGVQLDLGTGREPRSLFRQDLPVTVNLWGAAFDSTGRRLAVGASYARRAEHMVLRVFELATGATRTIPLVPPGEVFKGYEWNSEGACLVPTGGSSSAEWAGSGLRPGRRVRRSGSGRPQPAPPSFSTSPSTGARPPPSSGRGTPPGRWPAACSWSISPTTARTSAPCLPTASSCRA